MLKSVDLVINLKILYFHDLYNPFPDILTMYRFNKYSINFILSLHKTELLKLCLHENAAAT